MKRVIKRVALLSLILLQSLSLIGKDPLETGAFKRGEGVITFTEYKPLADKPINLYYYIPTWGNVSRMRVLFAMHPSNRNAQTTLDTWKEFAERDGFIVLAPQYPREHYDGNEYQRGGITVSARDRTARPQEKWTTNSIEAIFTYLKKETGNKAKKYDMWGAAWGAQFIEVFLLATPKARVRTAILAAPANYTMPFMEGFEVGGTNYRWPYSLRSSPFANKEHLKAFFRKHIIVHVGAQNNQGSSSSYPQGKATYGQGQTVKDRAEFFYNESRDYARKHKMRFNWEHIEIPGVGHFHRSMVYGYSRYNRTTKIRSYDINRVRETAGYYLLFGY